MGKISQALEETKEPLMCSFAKLMLRFDDEDREAVQKALDAKKPETVIAQGIRSGGFKVGHTTVGLHMYGKCVCGVTIK